jgi:hypothetical protein
LLLIAAIVDLRFGPARLELLDKDVLTMAFEALKVQVAVEWQRAEDIYKQQLVELANDVANDAPQSSATSSPDTTMWSKLFGVSNDNGLPTRPFNSVDQELLSFGRLAQRLHGVPARQIDPLKVLLGNGLKLIHRVASEVLAVPAGEAAAERLFSRAKSVFRPQRRSMSVGMLEKLTLLAKNKEFF